ncbi:MAG: DNA polymerase [Ilumatobacteraceae bacterium]
MTAPFERGESIAVAISDGVGAALHSDRETRFIDARDMYAEIERLELDLAPRWVWWTRATPGALVGAGIRPVRCWDIDAVHRLIHGGWRASPGRTWAASRGLDTDSLPTSAPLDLFSVGSDDGEPDDPIRPDGHLRPDWVEGEWRGSTDRLRRWAELALEVFHRQSAQLEALPDRPAAAATARAESTAALLCTEMEADGLPIDVAEAERIIGSFIGPRPTDAADELRLAAERDRLVLQHLGPGLGDGIDLRNPANVKSLLRRAGIELDDTRAWRLEQVRDQHPIVDALLIWRKAERICTTFGYRWLDEHVVDGRLRGEWSASDGAAGRMTATAGLHNMPADLRPAILAGPGTTFVRADLGQIEPRILAAVSGDAALASATTDADMYAPVAQRLSVPRETAKVAVLGAMYGQTTGHGAEALRGLERAYPVAMGFLAAAARAAEGGNDLRTSGGRLVRMSGNVEPDSTAATQRSRAAARGRYGRNAMVQGAAAEFFKTWAVIVRARAAPLDARIVLCLHDELLVLAPAERAADARAVVDDALQEAAFRWLRERGSVDVRFVTETSLISRWSDAK